MVPLFRHFFGRVHPDHEPELEDAVLRLLAMIGLLIRHANIHTDTSGVRRFDLLQEAARRRPRQVLFGSDGPWLHPGVELAKVPLLGLRAADARAVLGENALRLIEPSHRARPVRRRATLLAPASTA